MIRSNTSRYIALIVLCALLFISLAVRLFDMQVRHGEEYASQAQRGRTKQLRLTGNRGSILDCNGIPLAYDMKSYDVKIVKDPSRGSLYYPEYTIAIAKTIEIIEDNGGKVLADFVIKKDESGAIVFSFGKSISEELAARRETIWRSTMNVKVSDAPTAEDAYRLLRTRYGLADDIDFDQAYKILSIWQSIQSTRYMSYVPIVIAKNVNMTTVATIETRSLELTGVQISESTIRIYPKQTTAAHIVGYIGRMVDEGTMLKMEEAGYSREDLIGIAGVEYTMESELTANIESKAGKEVVEVDSLGKVVRQMDLVTPQSGNNVTLTIDLGMQKELEEALESNIKRTRAIQEQRYNDNKEAYDAKLEGRTTGLRLAEVGGAVVLSAKTCEVLAMASYPSFDANVFTGSMSSDELDAILNDPRHPLFNNAISSSATPGSIFKMVTGLAGLMEEAVTLTEDIDDLGEYRAHLTDSSVRGPRCWAYPYLISRHQNQNIILALKNSCNYYFFTVADRLGIDKLYKWAELLGLTSKTGIELPGETTGQMASQDSLYTPGTTPSGTARLVYNAIREKLVAACDENDVVHEDAVYDQVAMDMMALITVDEPGPDIRNMLRNTLGVPQTYITRTRVDLAINSHLNEIKWNRNSTIVSGIGQSVTLLTPIGVARYLSAIVNGGNVYDVSLIKSVTSPDGQVSEIHQESNLVRNLNVPQEYLDAIKEGMKEVVSGEDGTATDIFAGYKYLDQIGGKTGSAQVSDIDLETNSWFVAFAPFDDPEIVVVVYIPNGVGGIYSSDTAKQIIEYYLDKKAQEPEEAVVPQGNTLVR